VTPTGDAVAAFFDDLSSRGHEPSLRKLSGSLRFDLATGKATERWLVTIRKGELAVSRRNGAADSVIRAQKALFERAARGETNLFSAMLRGEVVLEGDYRLMVGVRRLFRERLAALQPRRTAGHAKRQR
jgi:putative sterol carrier protein